MFTKSNNLPKKIWFKERRNNKEARWYVGTVIGQKTLQRTSTSLFDPKETTWVDTHLLVEASDHRKIAVWETECFDYVRGGR